ncbi:MULTISPECIES: 5-(carboxyamino)imidazole ribonucleotide synthase [Candidatus Ichthyocystis]|uniref:5-(carboxyamino)imidazole ribonucleotide synthase n=1 Tax=Candidatus Ichthyocystis TaxID=2929841 RepID=UPI000AF48B85|nr:MULTISPECIES: ATP-grasp domain-containing protein [Ichthyocystis]
MSVIFPPAAVGVLGGGQLGRFFLQSARRQGYRTVVWDPDPMCPARMDSDVHICLPYDSSDAFKEFSNLCKAATIEFENVPSLLLSSLSSKLRVSPSANAVEICSNRILEKSFLKSNGFPVVDYCEISSEEDCRLVPSSMFPAILKTARMGYDGRGQFTVLDSSALLEAWLSLGVECVLEKRLSSEMIEFSVVTGRLDSGQVVLFPVTRNLHRGGILCYSSTICNIDNDVTDQLCHIASLIAQRLYYVGVLSIEFFYDRSKLYVNEMAPRPHNTGHYTMDAMSYSQFDCQQKILCGLEVFQPRKLNDAAMVNLLGDGFSNGVPDWSSLLNSGGRLYIYGKYDARPGRKMGHVTWSGVPEYILDASIEFYRDFYNLEDR